MPLPLIPIISALASGGSLVPHAAGGMIVSSATSSYIAGTYLSTAAIGGLLTTASTALGAGAIYLSGAAGSIVGGAGLFGTTVGASGITGVLMSVGIISATPIWVPLVVGAGAVTGGAGLSYGSYKLYKLKKKISNMSEGEEAQFTETEANIIERIIKKLGKKEKSKR